MKKVALTMTFSLLGLNAFAGSEQEEIIQQCLAKSQAGEERPFNRSETERSVFGNPVLRRVGNKFQISATFFLNYRFSEPTSSIQLMKEQVAKLDAEFARYLGQYGIDSDIRFKHSVDAGSKLVPGDIKVELFEYDPNGFMMAQHWNVRLSSRTKPNVGERDMIFAYIHEMLHSFKLIDEYSDGMGGGILGPVDSIMRDPWFSPEPRLYPNHIRTLLQPLCLRF